MGLVAAWSMQGCSLDHVGLQPTARHGRAVLHLQVVVERLRTEWKLDVSTGEMRVAYREVSKRVHSQ